MPNQGSYGEGSKTSESSSVCEKALQHCLLEHLPAGAYTCDPHGLITFFNQHASHIWGRTPKLEHPEDRFCGSHKIISRDGAELQRNQSYTALALQEGRRYWGEEVIFERPGGERRSVLAYVNPVHNNAGQLLGALNVLVDISAHKDTENALKDADRVKNTFLATLAHELRNPLAPLRNATEILHLKSPPIPEVQWALAVIDRQMLQMTRLVDDLLDVGRITSNKFDLRKSRISINDVLRAAVEISQPHIAAGHLHLYFNEPEPPILIDGDFTRLTQVIANLLHNAAKYTERGGKIWLSVEQQERHSEQKNKSQREVIISVRDTGIGIPPQLLPRIFDMFAQADQPPDRSPGGLGIGLTLAKQVVDAHGGVISACSEGAGMGSEFVVRLPAVVESTYPEFAHGKRKDAQVAPPKSQLRILVADDNKDVTESLVILLEIMGNEVRTARDGEDAMQMVASYRPDVVMLDIGMPKLDGYEVARRIREQPWGSDMVLIAFTGWGRESDRQRAEDVGFDHHVVKPVDPQVLMQLLSSLTKEKANMPSD